MVSAAVSCCASADLLHHLHKAADKICSSAASHHCALTAAAHAKHAPMQMGSGGMRLPVKPTYGVTAKRCHA